MAKQVTVLGLEGSVLRGVSLGADGDDPQRGAVDFWPLTAEVDGQPDEEASLVAGDDAPTENVAEEDRPLARAFRAAVGKFGTREFTLSLPLSRLLVKMVHLPAEARDDLVGAAQMELDSISPFPDEVLLPGVEVVAETDKEIVAVVAALPEAASAEISEAMAAAKVQVVRTDATAFGWLRSLWPRICSGGGADRRVVLFDLDDGWDLMVLDAGAISFLRGIGRVSGIDELSREVTLSLLQLGGTFDVGEIVLCTRSRADSAILSRLGSLGEVREVLVDDPAAGVEGVARRTLENEALDVTPASWRETRIESIFRRRLTAWMAVAGGVWLAVMAVLFGVDITYDFLTDRQKAMQRDRRHAAAFKEVSALKSRVELIQRYADHAHGALEVFKTISDALPPSQDMVFSSFRYRRDESVRVTGSATAREDLRTFMDNLNNASFEDAAEGEKLFAKVQQSGGETVSRKGAIRFTMEGFFHADDEESASKGNGGAK